MTEVTNSDARDARKLLVIAFDDSMRAQEFLLATARLVKEGRLALHDAVFINRDAAGHSTVVETKDLTPGRGALGGALWGALLGTLLGGPIGGLIGGAAAGGGGALLGKLIDIGIKDEQIKQLRETVRPGTTALALLLSHVSLADLQQELSRFPTASVVQSDLPAGALHAVRTALDEQPPVPADPNIRIGLDDDPPAKPPARPTATAEPARPAQHPDPAREPKIRIGLDDPPPA